MTHAAALMGRIASAGLRSPTARFGTRLTLKLGAAALGITIMAGFVPFAMDVAGQAPSGQASSGITVADGEKPTAASTPRRDAARLPLLDPAATASTGNWSKVLKPIAIFGVSAPELAGLPQRHESWRHSHGGRDDRLGFGEFAPVRQGSAAPGIGVHVHLSIQRSGEIPREDTRAFYIDLVRQSADLGLSVEKAQQPTPLTTKFGVMEVADATMTMGQHHRACLAFRFASERQPFRMAGWWCGAGAKPADRRQLACLLDRVDLLSAGEERDLRSLFTAAEKARDPACSSQRMVNIGRKTSWLDADSIAPSLRGGTRGQGT